jgi:3-carboxy-cis,cis-muconate cycloisomerase
MSGDGIVSERVMMGLGEKLGRQRGHDLVYDMMRDINLSKQKGERVGLVDLLMGNEEVIKAGIQREEVEEWCNVSKYLGYSEIMVKVVLKFAREEKAQ